MIVSIVVIVFILIVIFSIYNSLVRKRNEITHAFSSIDVMLKKRFDLIPNLIASVQQYAKHESSTFTQITEMRNKNYASMNESDKVKFDNEFSQCKNSLMAVAENYPELQASANFMQLQRSLNETEEQLSAARRAYNASVVIYNTSIETIPTLWFASMFGFTKNNNILVTPEQERQNVSVKDLFKN